MRVSWTVINHNSFHAAVDTFYPEAKIEDFTQTYEGEIVGTHTTFWGEIRASIMCNDGKIRNVSTHKLKRI